MKLRDYHPLNRAQLVRTASIMLHHFAAGFANPCTVCGSSAKCDFNVRGWCVEDSGSNQILEQSCVR
jgi:hypothetical protein